MTDMWNRIKDLSQLGYEEVYLFLIDKGRKAPELQHICTEENRIRNCQSGLWVNVWVEYGLLRIEATSSSIIVRGVMALLIEQLEGMPIDQINSNTVSWLASLNLSWQRTVGIAELVMRVLKTVQNVQANRSSEPGSSLPEVRPDGGTKDPVA